MSAAAASGAPAGPPGIVLQVVHETGYDYAAQVALAHHLAYLQPLDDDLQVLEHHELAIRPSPAYRVAGLDSLGNHRLYFALYAAHESLLVRASSRVRLRPPPTPAPAESPPWDRVRRMLEYRAGGAYQPAAEFCFPSPYVPRAPELRAYALASFGRDRPLLAAAIDLMHRIHEDFHYETASTEISTPVLEAFARRTGVCQDFTHVMLGCLRSLGLAARYVSGYLRTRPPAGQAPLVGADASHAWVAVWCPLHGWVELDPTNDVLAGVNHIRLARGRDYGDVTPLRGVVQGGGEHSLRVAVQVVAEEQPEAGDSPAADPPAGDRPDEDRPEGDQAPLLGDPAAVDVPGSAADLGGGIGT